MELEATLQVVSHSQHSCQDIFCTGIKTLLQLLNFYARLLILIPVGIGSAVAR
jgi:hypothetical protein